MHKLIFKHIYTPFAQLGQVISNIITYLNLPNLLFFMQNLNNIGNSNSEKLLDLQK
ncbi:hypothetical protein PIPA1_24230 [Pelosinus sp. IPA-1]|nr:hypothetical protein PIPA1_24230 [Pelosinus sp. IPA-1]